MVSGQLRLVKTHQANDNRQRKHDVCFEHNDNSRTIKTQRLTEPTSYREQPKRFNTQRDFMR